MSSEPGQAHHAVTWLQHGPAWNLHTHHARSAAGSSQVVRTASGPGGLCHAWCLATYTKYPRVDGQGLKIPLGAQEHVFSAAISSQAALDAAFIAPLVDFSVVVALRAASVPGSQLGMDGCSHPVAAGGQADGAASAILQSVPYGEQPCGVRRAHCKA